MQYTLTHHLPGHRFRWDWSEATFLKAVIQRSRHGKDTATMNRYITQAIHTTLHKAHGTHPNAIAPAVGIAYLLTLHTPEHTTLTTLANRIYHEYRQIPRTPNGAVSHRDTVIELWDDTLYMISLFLLEMYRHTGDETFLTELIHQINTHTEILQNPTDALFYHGWDADTIPTDDHCSQLGWSTNPQRRNSEYWGRGNGWIAAALADCLTTSPPHLPGLDKIQDTYLRMMHALLPLQDRQTGHWYQLPLYPGEPGNFIESSSTAMFGYAMTVGLQAGLLSAETFLPAVTRAFNGLAEHSLLQTPNGYTLTNVCSGTCIGDKAYYYNRKITTGTSFALGMAILFYDRYLSLTR
jgi:unsaturated rhamnogalacturonyl hydrolase